MIWVTLPQMFAPFTRPVSVLTPKILSVSIARRPTDVVAYISDLHVADPGHHAYRCPMPVIRANHGQLAICGDIGLPTDPRFRELFARVSSDFDEVYFVPGNHDYDCTSMYQKSQVNRYLPRIRDVCDSFPNVHLLDNTVMQSGKVWFAGTTLWSRPILRSEPCSRRGEHIRKHEADVHWLKSVIGPQATGPQANESGLQSNESQANKPVVVLSHFVPTPRLIEKKYQDRGLAATSWFATDLESTFMYPGSPVVGWIAGHSHSTLECTVNGTVCGLHAAHNLQ